MYIYTHTHTHVLICDIYMLYQLQRKLDEEEAPVDVAVVTPGLVASEIGNPVRGARSGTLKYDKIDPFIWQKRPIFQV